MTFTKDPSTHPANGPLTEERLIRVRDELAAAAKRSDGGNLGYMMDDAAKAIGELLALRKVEHEPIYQLMNYDWYDADKSIYEEVVNAGGTGRIVYAAPQLPQPAVVDADDNFYSWFGREWHENYQHNQYTSAAKQMLGVMAESAWKAGRSAAMLQGAEQQDRQQNIPENIPTLRDGVAAIRNSGIAIDAGKIQAERDALNTLDVPDGWMMVPKRLTAENGAKAALIGEFNLEYSLTCHECFGEGCEDCSGEGSWTNTVPIDWATIKDIWAKAIDHFAAAPQQEVK